MSTAEYLESWKRSHGWKSLLHASEARQLWLFFMNLNTYASMTNSRDQVSNSARAQRKGDEVGTYSNKDHIGITIECSRTR